MADNSNLLAALATVPMEESITPDDLAQALTTFPFVDVAGTFNTRDLGHPGHVRPGFIYRSGSLWKLTPEGMRRLVEDLQIQTIFDLRSAGEKKAFPVADSLLGEKIQVVSLTYDSPPSDVDVADYFNPDGSWAGGASGYSQSYLEMLAIFKGAFRQVLLHLAADHPYKPVLFNCTAGKDRTGVLAALILSVAGVPDEDIAFDYALSRIGIEPQKSFLTAVVKQWKPHWTPDTPGMREFSNVRTEYMRRFLDDAKNLYGDGEGSNWAETYILEELAFSPAQLESLRANLNPSEK